MITASAAMQTHIAGELLTLCKGMSVVRVDGTQFLFSAHDKDVVMTGLTGDQAFLNGTLSSAFSFTEHSIERGVTYTRETSDFEFLLDDSFISYSDLYAGKYEGARFTSFWFNWTDVSMGIIPAMDGRLGEAQLKNGRFEIEFNGLKDYLRRRFTRVYQPTCRVDLFSTECGLSAASFRQTATVASVTDRRTFQVGPIDLTIPMGQPSDYFDFGKVKFTSGACNGLSMEIDTYDSGTNTINLWLPMGFDIAAMDTLEVLPGCKKRWQEDCHTKYSNAVNFRGEPFIPGTDEIVKFPDP